MAKLSRFIMNSDYTANKQVARRTVSLSVPSKYIDDFSTSYYYTKDITVPSGIYFDSTTIVTSLNNSIRYPSSSVNVTTNGAWVGYISLFQKNATTYTLACTLTGYEVTTPAFTIDATVNLSLPPY